MHAFILAGGFATRLWPLTEKRAKPLLPLAGKPILTHLVESIPEDIPVTVSTNDVFKEGFNEWKKGIQRGNVEILIEETKSDDQKLGALGAVAQWVTDTNVQDDILLLTGDNFCGFSMEDFLQQFKSDTALIAVRDIGDLEEAKLFGTVIVKDNNKTIEAFEEKPQKPKSTLVSTGCTVIPASALSILVEFAKESPDNVGGIFEELLRKEKNVECFIFDDLWFDIGSFGAYLEATAQLVANRCLQGEGAICEKTKCEDSVVLGDNSRVRNSTLRNVVVFEDCEIEDCVLEDCIIDNSCKLHGIDITGKMLREGTELKKPH